MNVPRIQIDQTMYKLGWETQGPSYTFEPGRTTFTIEQEPAEINVERTQPRVLIDQSECWADMDRKNVFRRIAESASDGKQQVFNFIADVNAKGEQLGAIENKGNVIGNIARGKKMLPETEVAFRNVPGNFSLRMQGIPGETHVNWQPDRLRFNVQSSPWQHTYEKGKFEYYTQQKNRLQIQVVGGTIDTFH